MTSWFSMTTATVGGIASTYNGNLVEAGSDTYTYDYQNMMTSATIDSTTTDYTYDGDDLRSNKESTEYLYDRASGLPMMVDDGTNAYLHEGGTLATVDGSDDSLYLLDDALGSVRGVTDEAGDLVGSSDYDVYGEVRGSSDVSTLFRYTGEQLDAETGFTYLRARYLNPALGRFTSTDTVQPNAPGTQGYNPYAYVANNPTTWVDPSGNSIFSDPFNSVWSWFNSPEVYGLALAALRTPESTELAATGIWKITRGFLERNIWYIVGGVTALGFGIMICAMTSGPPVGSGCLGLGLRLAGTVADALPFGSEHPSPTGETDPNKLPATPTPPAPTPTTSPGAKCKWTGGIPTIPEGDLNRGMNHILKRHSASSPAGGGKFKWDSTERAEIESAIMVGALRIGPDWYVRADECVGQTDVGYEIGKHRPDTAQTTQCIRIYIDDSTAASVRTAYPVRCTDTRF